MLQQFTWQQFLIVSMLLTLIWYFGVILIFYRKQFMQFFKGKEASNSAERLLHRWDKDVEVIEESSLENEIMGRAKLPDGISSVSTESFGFAPSETDKADQVGLIPDLLQEIKEIFALLEKEDGSKNDFFNLMEVVKENYPKIGSHPNIGPINHFITDRAPFHLSSEELENLWD